MTTPRLTDAELAELEDVGDAFLPSRADDLLAAAIAELRSVRRVVAAAEAFIVAYDSDDRPSTIVEPVGVLADALSTNRNGAGR